MTNVNIARHGMHTCLKVYISSYLSVIYNHFKSLFLHKLKNIYIVILFILYNIHDF